MNDENIVEIRQNVINFPSSPIPSSAMYSQVPTPLTEEMIAESENLNRLSSYKSDFDWEAIRKLELRAIKNPIRGGFVFKSPFKLVNSHSTCRQCLYAFEVDTYGRGCAHNCLYCYAKAELTAHGYWNRPYAVPVDINVIRKVFYTVFETDKHSKWREIMNRRIPIRIGSMSDSFMLLDKKIGVTKEFLKILNYYKYPYLIFTRSDTVAHDEYLNLINPKLAAVQFSISSTNEKMNKLIEPGAPSAARRLTALTRLSQSGIWTTVRINPLFPIYPDGYFSDPNFKWEGEVPKFNYSSFEMVDEIADAGAPAILAGMGRFSSYAINQIQKVTNFDLRQLYKTDSDTKKSKRDFHFSDRETRFYYDQLKLRCQKRGVEFTTCYIGNGEQQFWGDQDIWSNKKDCCNVKNRVGLFKTDSREIAFEERSKLSGSKVDSNVDLASLHKPLGLSIAPANDKSPDPEAQV